MFKGGRYEEMFPKGLTDSWWDRFLHRHSDRLETGTKSKHELARELWATSYNIQQFYDVLEGVLLETGIRVLNQGYVEGKQWKRGMSRAEQDQCCRIVVVKPERIASADETEATTNMSQGSQAGKTKSERIVRMRAAPGEKQADTGQTLTNKSSCKASMYGGSFGSGKSLQPGVIWSVKQKVAWMQHVPRSTAVGPNGQ